MTDPKKAFTLHKATAAELPKVDIIWNAQDQLIAGGKTEGSSQGPYVTAYGLPAKNLPGCAQWAVGSEHRVDLAASGESWRATRFGWGVKDPSTGSDMYEWHRLDKLPDGVTTLEELCKHLRDKDPVAYPAAIYGASHLAKGILGNPACMLFDFWENRSFRHETIAGSGFHWDLYTKTPGKIKATAGKVTISHVLRHVVAKPKTAAAPGAGVKVKVDDAWAALKPYVVRLGQLAGEINRLLDAIRIVMEERAAVVTRFEVLRQLASRSLEDNGDPSPWNNVRLWCEQLVPALHKQLIEMPIDTTRLALNVFVPGKGPLGQALVATSTPDARASLEKSGDALRDLLLVDTDFRDALATWASASIGALVRGDETALTQLDELTKAASYAWYAFAEVGTAKENESLARTAIDQSAASAAIDGAGIKGANASEMMLSLVGKASKMPEAYGLREGPMSFRCAAVTAWATWRYQLNAAESLAELSALPKTAQDVALNMAKWKTFGDQLVEHLPEGVRTKVRDAMATEKLDSLAALKKVVQEDVAAEFPQPAHFGGTMLILNFISTALSLRETAGKPSNRALGLKLIDWADGAAGVAAISLGSYDYFLKASGREAPKWLSKASAVVGSIGAVISIMKGGVGFYQAAQKDDPLGAVGAASEVVGGIAALVVAAAAIAGATVPVAGQVALICLLVSGTISVADIARTTLPKPNQFVVGLITSAETSDVFRYAAANDGNIKRWLTEMKDYVDVSANPTKAVALPYFLNEYFNVREMKKIGLEKYLPLLLNLHNVGVANNPFGSGPSAGAPPPATGSAGPGAALFP